MLILPIRWLPFLFFCFAVINSNIDVQSQVVTQQPETFILTPELASVNAETAELLQDDRVRNKNTIALKKGVASAINGQRNEPDLVFNITAPPGKYVMSTIAVVDEEGAEVMGKAKTKYESLFLRLQFDEASAKKRVVYVPWNIPNQVTGKFELGGGQHQLKIWLPRGVRLGSVTFTPYKAPAVPAEAQNYTPKIIPPAKHPRLWVNSQSLQKIKSNVASEENRDAWEAVRKMALTPFDYKFDPNAEIQFDNKLERAVEAKAFYYLVTGDQKIGKEAIQLTSDYISKIDFGNILDITREIGRAIYHASEVYDWCYDLLSENEKKVLYTNLMRLAEDMEIGWPPFKTKIINGHGAEAQVNRDLLAMSIAVYNEDPLPYQYTSFVTLEELVPMRKFEYQSPRHNQGVNYASYRFNWEMHNAWLFYRMSGQRVFDDNIKNVPLYFLYMRTPDGQMLRDGDGFGSPAPGRRYYWKSPQTMFLCYTYSSDPILKGEFLRQGGMKENPVLFLLLNDPALKADTGLHKLPLTIDFGPVLGSMIARTGWNIGQNSSDVVAEIKGGGYHFGNHQHSDAGAVQFYYRGFQVADIGTYGFYGTPYDNSFNKRSVAHSMMLVVDPLEKFSGTQANDGGTKFVRRTPLSVQQLVSDSLFYNGKVISADFEQNKPDPSYSYFSVDLTGAYSQKIRSYIRSFCFLNLKRKDIPAVIILTDDITTSDPTFKKYLQINTHNPPRILSNSIVLQNKADSLTGKTHISMFQPSFNDVEINALSGDDANSVFNFKYTPPSKSLPESNANRIMISPKSPASYDRFVTVFQFADGDTKPLPVKYSEGPDCYTLMIDNKIVVMPRGKELIDQPLSISVPSGKSQDIILTGLKSGNWVIQTGKNIIRKTIHEGKNTTMFKSSGGKYSIVPH